MKRGIRFLALWLVLTVLLGGLCFPVIPPGGVLSPYYVFVACVPFGALYYARFDGRVSVVICYGLLAGVLFPAPIFQDEVGFPDPDMSVGLEALKMVAADLVMMLACVGGFALGRRLYRKDRTNTR